MGRAPNLAPARGQVYQLAGADFSILCYIGPHTLIRISHQVHLLKGKLLGQTLDPINQMLRGCGPGIYLHHLPR